MKYIFFATCLISTLFISCKSSPVSDYQKLDLMKYGMPISIKAPADATVKKGDLGIMQDVEIKSGDHFYIQVFSNDVSTLDLAKLKADKISEVKEMTFFSKIIEEDDKGFIFEKKIDENNINFDFRRIKLQGDKVYTFQTGLIGRFTEEDVRNMYLAVE